MYHEKLEKIYFFEGAWESSVLFEQKGQKAILGGNNKKLMTKKLLFEKAHFGGLLDFLEISI